MRKTLVILALSCLPLCANAQKVVTYDESSVTFVEPSQQVLTTPFVADVELVSGRITEAVTLEGYMINDQTVKIIAELKRIALGKIVRKYDADFLIGSAIDVSTSPKGLVVITVTGYPARYANFRKASTEDMDLINSAANAGISSDSSLLEDAKILMINKAL